MTTPATRITRSILAGLFAGGVCVAGVSVPATAAFYGATIDGVAYSFSWADGGRVATVTGYSGGASTLAIPQTVTDPDTDTTYTVTAIGDESLETLGLSFVTLPDTITSIGDFAFALNGLHSINIPPGVTHIGIGAFEVNYLTWVDIPSGLTVIEPQVFRGNSLGAIALPPGVTTIGDWAFQDNDLATVTIPPGVTSIGANAFADNPSASVLMEGAPPSTIGATPFGTAGSTAPEVWFYSNFLSAGYTAPTWLAGGEEYASRATTSDIAGGPFEADVQWMVDQGISTGYADGTFRPMADVSRQAMAAFMYRFAGSPAFTTPATSPFNDVATDSPFYAEVTWMADQGISAGYPDGGFHPLANVSRQAMAAFMYRFAGSPAFTPPVTSPFNDVATDASFYAEITWVASNSISTGYADGGFHPAANVSRQAMSAFMFRLDGVLHP